MQDPISLPGLLLRLESVSPTERTALFGQIEALVSFLLEHDFSALVRVLYTVDVSETKLRELLRAQPGSDAAALITRLLIERQEEKIRSRKSFRPGGDIPEDQKW